MHKIMYYQIMAISVQSLFNSTADIYRLKMISGKEWALRPVSWMYYTEDVSTLNFLRGGELVVTTGMEIGRLAENNGKNLESYTVEYLSRLVNAVTEQRASGLILNMGKYIQAVPEEIIQLCQRLQLPLLTMPWEIHIIDIMQDYGNRIVNDRQKGNSLEKTLFNAMFNHAEFNILELENTTFAGAKEFSVILLEVPEILAEKNEEDFTRYMEYSFNLKTGLLLGEYSYFLYEDKIVYIFHDDAHNHFGQIEKAARKDKNFECMRISVSGVCSAAEELADEFRHADLALKLCDPDALTGDYNKLGIFQLLGEVQNRAVLERMYNDVLGPLNVFGKEKLDDYLNTLRLYLCSSGKVQKTAEENSTHRNTVNYRIRKICDTLNIDLSNGETRYMIQTALYIKDLLKKSK